MTNVRYVNYTVHSDFVITTTNKPAPNDGVLGFGSFYASNTSVETTGYVAISINDKSPVIGSVPKQHTSFRPITCLIPVKKGDNIRYITNVTVDGNIANLFAYY